jgi:CD109 antigen
MLRAQTSLGKPIVHWLQTRRNFVAGWCSSYDSFFALKSLVNYAIRHGDTIQQYNLRVNMSSSHEVSGSIEPILITDDNIIDINQRSIESVYGRVLIDAYGIGYALIQMKTEVNVEYPELIRPVPYVAFDMSLNIHLSNRYNFSFLIYEPCVTYVII